MALPHYKYTFDGRIDNILYIARSGRIYMIFFDFDF